MVPHIVFHGYGTDYAPGPEVWDSAVSPLAPELPTSGITQPPVLASAVRALHEAAPEAAFLAEVVPTLESWHDWLHRERAAENSPRFDRAPALLDTEGAPAIERLDRRVVDASERPTATTRST